MRPGIQIACALLWNLFAAGVVFGFSALKPILFSQGVYSDLCENEVPCQAQDLRLNLMFTFAAGVTNIVALVVGFILDSRGPRVCGFIGSFFLASGALLFAYSNTLRKYIDPYMSGYVSLAIGGPFVFISTFQLANAVPKHSGKILAAITGAFDSSSALFMLYRIYYQNIGQVSLFSFFSGYLLVPLFITVCQLFVMPKGSYRSLGAVRKLHVEGLDEEGNLPDGVDPNVFFANEAYRDEILSRHVRSVSFVNDNTNERIINRRVSRVSDTRRRSVLEEVVNERLGSQTKGVYGILHGVRASDQIKSKWFLYALVLTILCMLRLNYFMATVRSQEAFLLNDPRLAAKLGNIFDVLLPLGGVLAIPFVGWIIDTVPTIQTLKGMCFVSVLVGVLGLFPSYSLNLVGIVLLVVYRPFYYTVVSDYCSKVFGFETFGTVYGLLMTISGIFNMFQSVIDRLTHTTFNMNPTPLNALLTGATAVISVIFLYFVERETNLHHIGVRELAIE